MVKRQKRAIFSITRGMVNAWILVNAVVSVLLLWALYLLVGDPEGWSYLLTWPIFLAATILTALDIAMFIVLAIKRPVERPKHRVWYVIIAILAMAPAVSVTTYRYANAFLIAAAQARQKVQLSLSEAERLISDCKVDTLYLSYGGTASVKLREEVFILPGARAQNETRMLNPNDFEQILELARRKDVQDRCGYIPTYDIRRARMRPIVSWITVDQAKRLICSRSWLVEFWPDGYTPMPALPASPSTGILLSAQPSVWNDDVHSDIILTSTDAGISNTLSSFTTNPTACK